MEKKPRKKIVMEEIEDDEGSWLLSYADMMTLVACFFILMMAFANFDPAGFTKKTKIIAKHFNKDKFKSSEIKLKELTEEIAKHPEIIKKSKITVHDSEVVISFSGTVLFDEAGIELNPQASVAVDTLVDIIKTLDPNFNILVEGHSDSFEAKKGPKGLRSSWSIAGARAATIVEKFEFYGFKPQNLKAVSWGDSKPLKPNTDKEGKVLEQNVKLNRRVIVKVIEPLNKRKNNNFGIGVYYD
jgi:chemotaxis protein MotB